MRKKLNNAAPRFEKGIFFCEEGSTDQLKKLYFKFDYFDLFERDSILD